VKQRLAAVLCPSNIHLGRAAKLAPHRLAVTLTVKPVGKPDAGTASLGAERSKTPNELKNESDTIRAHHIRAITSDGLKK
jgi:hypothetical protein